MKTTTVNWSFIAAFVLGSFGLIVMTALLRAHFYSSATTFAIASAAVWAICSGNWRRV